MIKKKNTHEEVILYWFWNFFPILENITLFLNLILLAKIHALSTSELIYILFVSFSYSSAHGKLFFVFFSCNYLYLQFLENVKNTVMYLKLFWFKEYLSIKNWNCSISYQISG